MRLPFLMFALLAVFSCPAQTRKLDSLLTELQLIPVDADTAHQRARAVLAQRIGINYHQQKDYENSRRYYREALRLATQLQQEQGVAFNLEMIGHAYEYESRFAEALDTFLLSYRHWEQLRDTGKMAKNATFISMMYGGIPKYEDKELEYAKICMDLSLRAGRLHGLCACSILVGDVFEKLGETDSMAIYLEKGIEFFRDKTESNGLSALYVSMARAQSHQRNYHQELEWLLKARQTQEKFVNGDDQFLANINLLLGNCYLHLGDLKQATSHLAAAQKIIVSLKDLTYQERLYEHLSRLAELQNRPNDALRYYKLHVAARDSINDEKNTRRVTQIQMTYDFEKKQSLAQAEQERELALRDVRSQQQRLVFALVLLVLLGGVAFGFYSYRQRQERRRTELELANLRAQINPHFIFNCLNSIYRYTKERDTDTAAKYLQKFSSLLRLVLENSRTEKITLARDLEALQLYVDIEALRFKEKLRFSLEIDPEIDPTFLQIPGMLIQPHVENAIWHGLMHRPAGGQLCVRLTLPAEDLLHVEIEDDGIGRAASAELESKSALTRKSLGQKITAERLKATGKLAYFETIDLTDKDGNAMGTRVVMEIPLAG